MKEERKQFGFTLIEVLIVVALIVVLVSMVLVATNKTRVDAENQLTRATIGLLDTALQEYYEYTNNFPEPNSIGPDTAFDSIHSLRNASLYAQLNLVPGSKKILGRIEDSQIMMVDNKIVSFKDHWETVHQQNGYLVVLDAWGGVFDYLYDEDLNTFPVIKSAGSDRDFLKALDNIDNRE